MPRKLEAVVTARDGVYEPVAHGIVETEPCRVSANPEASIRILIECDHAVLREAVGVSRAVIVHLARLPDVSHKAFQCAEPDKA